MQLKYSVLQYYAVGSSVSSEPMLVLAGNCSATHQGCETVWNRNVQPLYRDLIEGTLTKADMQSFCRLCLCTSSMLHLTCYFSRFSSGT